METKETLTISIDAEVMRALNIYLSKNGAGSVQKELEKRLRELYDEAVPDPVREYIGMRFRPTVTKSRPKKPAKAPAASATEPQPAPAQDHSIKSSEEHHEQN